MLPIDQDLRLTVAAMIHELEGAAMVFGEVRDAHRRRVFSFEFDFTTPFKEVPPMPEALTWQYPVYIYLSGEGRTVKRKVDRLHQLTFL